MNQPVIKAAWLLLSAAGLLLPSALMAQTTKKKVSAPAQTIHGRFIGFEMGDYLHAGIRTRNGEERWFRADSVPCLDYFLPTHAEHEIELSYRSVTVFIPEAGTKEKITKALDAQAGGEQCSAWWRQQQATMTPQQIEKRYQPLFEKALQR